MRPIRLTRFALVLACALALGGCGHVANNAGQSKQATGSQSQTASGQSQPAQPAEPQAQTQPAAVQPADAESQQPANPPTQPVTGAEQSAASSGPVTAAGANQLNQPGEELQDQAQAQAQAQPADNTAQNQGQPPEVTIPDGTPIEVRLTQSLGSARSARGQTFAATLDAPIVVGNAVVVPQGANVTGQILFAKRSGRLKGPAELAVTLTSLEVDGQFYGIVTSHKNWRGESHKKRNLGWIGGGSGGGALIGVAAGGGVGAAIGAGVGAGGGAVTAFVTGRKNIVLPSETRLRFVLRRSVTVTGS
jgi:hypothetical protein